MARQLNAFAARLKAQRQASKSKPKTVREPTAEYVTNWPGDFPLPLFTEEDLQWLQAVNI